MKGRVLVRLLTHHTAQFMITGNKHEKALGVRSVGLQQQLILSCSLSSEMALEVVCQSACRQVHNDSIAQHCTCMVPGHAQALFLLVNAR